MYRPLSFSGETTFFQKVRSFDYLLIFHRRVSLYQLGEPTLHTHSLTMCCQEWQT